MATRSMQLRNSRATQLHGRDYDDQNTSIATTVTINPKFLQDRTKLHSYYLQLYLPEAVQSLVLRCKQYWNRFVSEDVLREIIQHHYPPLSNGRELNFTCATMNRVLGLKLTGLDFSFNAYGVYVIKHKRTARRKRALLYYLCKPGQPMGRLPSDRPGWDALTKEAAGSLLPTTGSTAGAENRNNNLNTTNAATKSEQGLDMLLRAVEEHVESSSSMTPAMQKKRDNELLVQLEEACLQLQKTPLAPLKPPDPTTKKLTPAKRTAPPPEPVRSAAVALPTCAAVAPPSRAPVFHSVPFPIPRPSNNAPPPPPPPPPPHSQLAPEVMAQLNNRFNATEVRKFFVVQPSETVEQVLHRRIELLMRALNEDDGYKRVVAGGDADSQYTDGEKREIRNKCMLLLVAYKKALELMPSGGAKNNFIDCCAEAVDVLRYVGVHLIGSPNTAMNAHREFRETETFACLLPKRAPLPTALLPQRQRQQQLVGGFGCPNGQAVPLPPPPPAVHSTKREHVFAKSTNCSCCYQRLRAQNPKLSAREIKGFKTTSTLGCRKCNKAVCAKCWDTWFKHDADE